MSTEVETAIAAPVEAEVSSAKAAEDATAPVFFSKTIARLVKKNTAEKTRTTPASRDLVREYLEKEGGELCRKAFLVAQHARGAPSGSRKRSGDGAVRVMPKDLALVLRVMSEGDASAEEAVLPEGEDEEAKEEEEGADEKRAKVEEQTAE